MISDPFVEFKKRQREGWAYFAPIEAYTTPAAAHLVRFAGVRPGQTVLDVGTGTGVVAITARRGGAVVTGLDLTPELLTRARENAVLADVNDIVWQEGDAENLPFANGAFDVVLSQFGHMFAPRPDVATREMLRVLKPGGRLAFATWPPEHFVGKMFGLIGTYIQAPPGVPSPADWGDPAVIRDRLGSGVRDIDFERGIMMFPALSPQHYRNFIEKTAGPVIGLVQNLQSDRTKLGTFRMELEALVAQYMIDNTVPQEYLLTRAIKL
ncbi:MAG: class I SAM-dependent methyltransferase [bacterium]